MSDFSRRRFVFIDFENLRKVQFKQLERVASRVFILIDEREKSIPFSLVKEMQNLGKAIRWVPVPNVHDKNFNLHIAFLLGKFHQKINKHTEFIVLSNDTSFDSLMTFINDQGRSCLRVKSKTVSKPSEVKQQNGSGSIEADTEGPALTNAKNPSIMDEAFSNGILESSTNDTIRKLAHLKNRPAELAKLRRYVTLHNEEFAKRGSIDEIIRQMERKNKIAIKGARVTYNFE
jgi:hypothetical protein